MELPDIIDQILANEKPELVCQQISMCANSSAVVVAQQVKASSGICNMCQLVVTQVGTFYELYDIYNNILQTAPSFDHRLWSTWYFTTDIVKFVV